MYTKLVTAALAMTLVSGTAYAQGYNEKESAKSELIIDWEQANGICRGTPGGRPDSPACKMRETLGKDLEKLNQCYGKTGEAEYQKKWHPCTNGSIHVDGVIGKTTDSQMTLKQEH